MATWVRVRVSFRRHEFDYTKFGIPYRIATGAPWRSKQFCVSVGMTCRTGNHKDDAPADLCLVTTYFNPAGYTKKRKRYLDFAARCEVSNLTLFTIECAFGNRAFEIPEAETVLHVRARDAMWQKERLLNLATAHIPAKFTKLVSIDFDVIFENPQWAILTSQQLDVVPLVQPFETVVWLPRDAVSDDGSGRVLPGFAERHATDPSLLLAGDFVRHGVPGFARAARRELLEAHGLYDACVVGGGAVSYTHLTCNSFPGTNPMRPRTSR